MMVCRSWQPAVWPEDTNDPVNHILVLMTEVCPALASGLDRGHRRKLNKTGMLLFTQVWLGPTDASTIPLRKPNDLTISVAY